MGSAPPGGATVLKLVVNNKAKAETDPGNKHDHETGENAVMMVVEMIQISQPIRRVAPVEQMGMMSAYGPSEAELLQDADPAIILEGTLGRLATRLPSASCSSEMQRWKSCATGKQIGDLPRPGVARGDIGIYREASSAIACDDRRHKPAALTKKEWTTKASLVSKLREFWHGRDPSTGERIN